MMTVRRNALRRPRWHVAVRAVVVVAVGLISSAQAQDWPQKPVRIIAPFAAGGSSDPIVRIIAQRLGEASGQQFVVDNRPGASGTIAAELVARSPPDGHTLLLGSPSQITIAPTATKTSYDPTRDFAPISVIGSNPFVLVVHPSLRANNLAEFIDLVHRQPRTIAYAHAGFGTIVHLSTVLFLKRAGIEMIPVIYRGGAAPALTDVMAGHVSSYLAPLASVVPHASSGALRLLAVSSEKRAPQIPDVPTFIESGFPGYSIRTWNGLMAPAGTPREIIERIAKEVAGAVKDPKIAERLIGSGVDPLGNSPQEFATMIAADLALWAEAIEIAGVQEK
jgi:tripartite-type tricarboxylate transporter receptor subunit TctC